MLVPSLQRYQACPLSKPGIDLVPLIFSRVPCVTNRSHIELIERYFRVPIELRDRIRDQPILREEDQIVGVHAIVSKSTIASRWGWVRPSFGASDLWNSFLIRLGIKCID